MKYYVLKKQEVTGLKFCYCNSTDLKQAKQEFNPDGIEEIDKKEYDLSKKVEHRKFLRLATGYPK